MSIRAFKAQLGCESIQILRNPKTNKLFASLDTGGNIKVEQAIDTSKDMVVLVEDGNLTDACIINKRETAEILATL